MDIKVEPISKILVDKNDIMHYNKRVVRNNNHRQVQVVKTERN